MNKIATAEDAKSLADACGILSQLLLKGNVELFFEAMAANPAALRAWFPRTCATLEGADEETVGGEQLLAQIEYARLLCNGCQQAIHPYESVYLGKDHLLMQEPRDAVVDFYAELGFEASAEPHLPEDHACFELALIQMLADRIAAGEEPAENLSALDRFASEHALAWMPAFAQDLKDAAETNFWIDCANLLRTTLQAF